MTRSPRSVSSFTPVRLLRHALCLVAAAAWPAAASAALGGTVASVEADRIHAQGSLTRIVRSDTYALHEIRSAAGTMIREYVSSSGTVFAVAWQGPWMPDMSQVLGAHYEHYQRAMTARARTRRSRGLVVIDDQDLVVQMSGHPRSFSGRAYIPGLVPQGMQIDAI